MAPTDTFFNKLLDDEKHNAEKNDTLDYIIEGVEKIAVEIAGIDDNVKDA